MQYLILGLYAAVSCVLLLYAANAYYLIAACFFTRAGLRSRNEKDLSAGREILAKSAWPSVTTQIPIYNEIAVAERVIRAVAAMDYPQHSIQVLDDSTDDTREIVDAVAGELRRQGFSVEVIRRTDRKGYKAGALAEGLARCESEFIAIFDADFLPQRTSCAGPFRSSWRGPMRPGCRRDGGTSTKRTPCSRGRRAWESTDILPSIRSRARARPGCL